jgi:hypothetical protein
MRQSNSSRELVVGAAGYVLPESRIGENDPSCSNTSSAADLLHPASVDELSGNLGGQTGRVP